MMSLFIQLSSGKGPVECGRATFLACSFLLKELNDFGVKAELQSKILDSAPKTYKSAVISIKSAISEEVRHYVESWEGTVQWSCSSPFRPSHKRKNWFLGVEVIKPPEKLSLEPRDIKLETFRASGPGGQHVNTTDSAVRATHIPTGISVIASEERSQAMNRRVAFVRLAAKIEQVNSAGVDDYEKSCWDNHNELQRGNPVRTFKGPNFKPSR